MPDSAKNRVVFGEAVARAMEDTEFRGRLISSPKETLVAEGAEIPDNIAIKAVENTPTVIYAILPPPEQIPAYQAVLNNAMKQLENLPKGVEVRIVQTRDDLIYIPIPPLTPAGKLQDEQLEVVAGGKHHGHSGGSAVNVNAAVNVNVAATANVEAAANVTSAVNAAEVFAVAVAVIVAT